MAARKKIFTERLTEVRYTPEQKADIEEAVALLRRQNPSMNFSVWCREILHREAVKVLKRKQMPVDLPDKQEVERADKGPAG